MAAPDPDSALLRRFVEARDEAAFTELARRHWAGAQAACRRVLGAGPEAEDAAQAALVTLAAKAGSLLAHPALGAWLHRTATHIALRAREERDARRRREAQAAPRDEGIARGDLLDRLDEALEGLPEGYRVPVLLHHCAGLSHDEIAARLGLRTDAVAARISRGRKRLRRALLAGEAALLGALGLLATDAAGAEPPAGLASAARAGAAAAEAAHRGLRWSTALAALLTVAASALLGAVGLRLLERPQPAQDHAMTTPAARKPSFRYSFNWCADVAAIRRFYHELLGLELKVYRKTEGKGSWAVFDTGGTQVMFMEPGAVEVAKREGFAAQFGYDHPKASTFDASWGVEYDDEAEFRAAVARLQAAPEVKLLDRDPAWRQDCYWGLTALDPMGTTVEISVTPKARPASTTWK